MDIWETPLWRELDIEGSELIDNDSGDYGYGGEWHSYPSLDKEKVIEFIEARERRLLKGETLEEHVAPHPPVAFMFCQGCGSGFPIPWGVKEALEHDAKDTCHRMGDREAEGWRLGEKA